jgi:hypothetical protein
MLEIWKNRLLVVGATEKVQWGGRGIVGMAKNAAEKIERAIEHRKEEKKK